MWTVIGLGLSFKKQAEVLLQSHHHEVALVGLAPPKQSFKLPTKLKYEAL